jgi:hypothetical protein
MAQWEALYCTVLYVDLMYLMNAQTVFASVDVAAGDDCAAAPAAQPAAGSTAQAAEPEVGWHSKGWMCCCCCGYLITGCSCLLHTRFQVNENETLHACRIPKIVLCLCLALLILFCVACLRNA